MCVLWSLSIQSRNNTLRNTPQRQTLVRKRVESEPSGSVWRGRGGRKFPAVRRATLRATEIKENTGCRQEPDSITHNIHTHTHKKIHTHTYVLYISQLFVSIQLYWNALQFKIKFQRISGVSCIWRTGDWGTVLERRPCFYVWILSWNMGRTSPTSLFIFLKKHTFSSLFHISSLSDKGGKKYIFKNILMLFLRFIYSHFQNSHKSLGENSVISIWSSSFLINARELMIFLCPSFS